MKKLSAILALSFLLTSTYSGASVDQILFGPKRYDRSKGKPAVYTETFAGCKDTGTAILRIDNGDSDKTRITSAEITVNGGEIVRENEFKRQTAVIEKIISVRASNTLSVKLKSGKHDGSDDDKDEHKGSGEKDSDKSDKNAKTSLSGKSSKEQDSKDDDRERDDDREKDDDREDDDRTKDDDRDEHHHDVDSGSFIIVTVIGQGCDSAAPIISNLQPADGSLINNAQPVVSAQYADEPNGSGVEPASVRLTLDGQDVTAGAAVSAGGISYTPSSRLTDGLHSAVLNAADRAGNEASLTWHFSIDTVAPVVTITSHQNNQYVLTRTITLSGSVNDPAASVSVNGLPAQVAGSSFTLASLALAEGPNRITVEAKDPAGNAGSTGISITVDSIAPAPPVMTQPASPTNSASLTLVGTTEPLAVITVATAEGALVGTAIADGEGSFSLASVTLAPGANTYTAKASDAAGNASMPSSPVSVILDTVIPVVTITSPQSGSYLKTPEIAVTGTVNETVASVTVNGAAAVLSGTSFSLSGVQLAEGPNTILVEATDLAGNPGTASPIVILDTVAPVAAIATPLQGAVVRTPKITVSGTLTELNPAEVWVNGARAQLLNGVFILGDVLLSEGTNTIPVRASDPAGNESTATVTLTLDTVPPVVSISVPAADLLTNQSTLSVSGMVQDAGSQYPGTDLTVTVNGLDATVINGQFSLASLGLTEGPNAITATAKDRAGNTNSASITVTLDSGPPPAPVFDQPVTPTRVAAIALSGTVEASSLVTLYSGTVPDAAKELGTVTADGQGRFSQAGVTLAEGENAFTAVCADNAGNKSPPANPVLVVLDTRAPLITVASPANNSFSSVKDITLTGTVTDEGGQEGIVFTINGTPVSVNANNAFSHLITLQGGRNTIQLSATDGAGNASAALEWMIELDTTPLVVTITSPAPGLLVKTPRITVAGTVNKVLTTVTVNGIPSLVSGLGFSLNDFVLHEGSNPITVEATDRAGNTGSGLAAIRLDTLAPVISLQAPAQAAAGTSLSVSLNASDGSGLTLAEITANGVALWSASLNSDLSTQQSVLYSLSPDLAPGTVIHLQARALDVLGTTGTAATQILVSQGPSGPGYIQGEVYDDSRGLRLEGAEVTISSAANGRELPRIATGPDGGYFVETEADTYVVSVSKPGYTSVKRLVTVRPEKKAIALDARLTPLSQTRNLIDQTGGIILAPLGLSSVVSNPELSTLNLELSLAASALVQQTDLRLTPVSNQGLSNLLPSGWSPIGIVDIRSLTAEGSEIAAGTTFAAPASLKVPAATGLGLTPSSPVVFVRFDNTSLQWIVQASGTVSADALSVTANVASTDQYALVLPDDLGCLATVGAALPQCGTLNSELNTPNSFTASGSVIPAAAPPSLGLKAVGQLVLSSNSSNEAVNSGLIINAKVTERFDLLSGDPVVPSDYVQDLVLYRYPCSTGLTLNSELGTLNSGKIGTSFPVSPSKDYTIADLMLGKVGISILLPEIEPTGTLIGTTGGRVLDGDGNVLVIPSGALGQTAPVQTRTVPASTLSGVVGADFTLLRAVEVNLTRQVLSVSAELSIPIPAGFDPALPVVVARTIDVRGVQKLKLVALGRLSGSLITSVYSNPPTPPFDKGGQGGIASSGTYFFLQARSPLGYVTGTVTGLSGGPAANAYVTSSTCSLVDLTNTAGTYLVAAKVSAVSLTAMDLAKYDSASVNSTVGSENQVIFVNLTIAVTRPSIVSLVPGDNAVKVEPNAPIVMTFSEPVSKNTVTDPYITLKDSSGNKVAGAFSINSEGNVVTFYPTGVFQSEAQYSLFISREITDLQGYTMTQDVTATFTIKDTTPPPMPAAGSITATFPDATGYVTVTGTQSSVEPNCAVLIINDSTGEIVTVAAQQDGSFTGRIMAMLGDEIKIVILDASGNQTLVSYITFKSDDGRYLVTSRGGVVEGEGGTRLEIPEGALVTPTVVNITPLAEDQLAHPAPPGAHYLAAVNIDTGGVNFQKEVHLSVPAPAGVATENNPFVAQPQEIMNSDGTVEKVYVIHDSAKVIDGRLTTASPPFAGLVTFGPIVFMFPDMYNAVVSGYTYWDKDGVDGYNPQYDANGDFTSTSDRPIKGAIIRSFGGYQYISYSNKAGHYAIFGLANMEYTGDCRMLRTTAINPMTAFQRKIDIALCKPDPIKINFRLADATTQLPDNAAPSVQMNLQVAPNADQDDTHQNRRFLAGTIAVGTNIEVPISIIDQEVTDVTLAVKFSVPGQMEQEYAAEANPVDSSVYTAITADNPVAIWKYAYRGKFLDPALSGGGGNYFRPGAPGTYTLVLTARDAANHITTKRIQVRAVLSGDQPGGIDGNPQVDEIIPAGGSTNVLVTMPVTVTFSEPVNVASVNEQSLKLIDLSTNQSVPATRYTTLDGGRVKAVLTPLHNLVFGRDYQVVVTQDIIDDVPNPSAPAGSSYYNLVSEYTATFRTKDPQAYDITGEQFTAGRDIALFTEPNTGQTYAYVASNEQGWYAVNITDPTKPFVTHKENWNTGSASMFRYRGAGVDQENGILGVTEWIQPLVDWGLNAGYVRFYSLAENPQKPLPRIGQDKIADAGSGVPDRIAISGKYAYITTIMVGLQVVDIEKTKGPHEYGETVVGMLPTVEMEDCPQSNGASRCGNPSDLALYKGNRLLIPTSSGYLMVVDVSEPTLPNVLSTFKPTGFSAWRVGVGEGFQYDDAESGQPKIIDIAVVGSQYADSRIYTVDVTDGYSPVKLGVVTDSDGNEVQVMPNRITVSAATGLAYATTGSSVYVIDIKDPYHPRLLNVLTDVQNGDASGTVTLGMSMGLVEKDGWVYLANQQAGMRVLDLDPLLIYIYDANFNSPDEVKYSDGAKLEKKYQIVIKPNGQSAITEADCNAYNGYGSTISILDKKHEIVNNQEYVLSFKFEANECRVKIASVKGQFFILSNRDSLDMPVDTVKLSPGLNGRYLQVKIPTKDGKTYYTAKEIERLGVIVLGIDGLRQDVLYPEELDAVKDGGKYRVKIEDLPGLKEILVADQSADKKSYIMLPEVTAIFPSITFASWASIFTGKMPNETGITGNEFFARDLITGGTNSTSPTRWNKEIPGLKDYPPGMVTLDADGGAFRPSGGFLFAINNAIPIDSFSDQKKKRAASAPASALLADPLWHDVNDLIRQRYNGGIDVDVESKCELNNAECRTVSIFNQYPINHSESVLNESALPPGVDRWGTANVSAANIGDAFGSFGSWGAKMLDKAATNEAVSFISNYFDKNTQGRRKSFPALFSVYLAGLDHDAHLNGLGGYVKYFKDTVDVQIKDIVDTLKKVDEFENKIFIIIADHGHTAMPTDLKYARRSLVVDLGGNPVLDVLGNKEFSIDQLPVDMSCNLKTAGFTDENVQEQERRNNALHIWELANLFTQFPATASGVELKILAPKEIAEVESLSGATADIDLANVIAALNGPMAHIYVKGETWQSQPDPKTQQLIISRLFHYLKTGATNTIDSENLADNFPNLRSAIDAIIVRDNNTDSYQVVKSITENSQGGLEIERESLESHFSDSTYVDVVRRITGIGSFNRSGDIILVMNNKTEDSASKRMVTSYACKSWHGSLNKSDSYVPFIISYPAGNSQVLDSVQSEVCVSDTCKSNWGLPDIVKFLLY